MPLDQEKLTTYPIHGFIDGPESRPIKVDKWTRGLITVSNDHHQLWRGYNFVITASTLVDAGGGMSFYIDPNYSRPDFRFYFKASNAAINRNWLPAQRTYVPANVVIPKNRNVKAFLEDGMTSAMSICHTPATTGSTQEPTDKIYMGSVAGPGGISSSGGERTGSFLLTINVAGVFEVLATANDCAITMEFSWTEFIPYDQPPLVVVP